MTEDDRCSIVAAIHDSFLNTGLCLDATDLEWLSSRRIEMLNRVTAGGASAESLWASRAYPVLAVVAPVMSSHIGKIEFPGDPMCLYSALSYAIDRVVQVRQSGSLDVAWYNDYAPAWGKRPSPAYRASISDSGIRPIPDNLPVIEWNTDQTVFDPRVWNTQMRRYFREELLRTVRPKVVLISTVSPGQRYSFDIAQIVKEELPDCIVVLGGRHVDETIRYAPSGSLSFAPSSPVAVMADERGFPGVDIIVSGEGYYALDLVMRAVSLSMDLRDGVPSVSRTIEALQLLGRFEKAVAGQFVIVVRDGSELHAFPVVGRPTELETLPAPYSAHAIRARFPIFTDERGDAQRTAHIMFTAACTYHCSYCSEASHLVGRLRRFRGDSIEAAIARVVEYVSYGAESLFFDDSILWAGDFKAIRRFCLTLAELRRGEPTEAPEYVRSWLTSEMDWQRLRELQWGAQLTVDLLTVLRKDEDVAHLLATMRNAGCTYIYLGIESLADEVVTKLHKNLHQGESWEPKVRRALERLQTAGIRAGSSVLFGLEGETRATIDHTISGVARLIDDGLLMIASPNILTYHPATQITRMHKMADKIDYHTIDVESRPPYVYFEEAFPGVVSRTLSEKDIWYIHESTRIAWGSRRNSQEMAEPELNPNGR